MTPEAQRIAIAEACGWREIKHRASPTHPSGFLSEDRSKDWLGAKQIPDYLSDLNAMHEAEKVLTKEEIPQFIRYVWDQVAPLCADYANTACFHITHATAAQRAEAFLRTIGKWEDGK